MFDVAVGTGVLAFSVFLWKGARRGRCLAPLPAPASPPILGGREGARAGVRWARAKATDLPLFFLLISFFLLALSVVFCRMYLHSYVLQNAPRNEIRTTNLRFARCDRL